MTDETEHHVSKARYPIPQPLAERLRSGIAGKHNNDIREVDSLDEALAHLVANSIEAVDTMYFAAPAALRQHPAFVHRLCLRIASDGKMLTVTDYGIGCTRADLINGLGVGRAVSSSSHSEDLQEDGLVDTEDDDDNGEDTKKKQTATAKSCRGRDIGGFYAALCALGTGVRVSTKSKFDDYYEFELGVFDDNNDAAAGDDAQSLEGDDFSHFTITRPLPEGSSLSVATGFHQFEQIRGESGTMVSIRLNAEARAAGLGDEAILKQKFLKIVETTQYTVAFSSDPQAHEIVDASAKEELVRVELQQEMEKADALEAADVDLQSRHVDDGYYSVKERAKYIPLRLSLGERKILRLVEASMNCCDYTTEVDRPFKSAARRMHEQMKGITAVLRGLVTACDYDSGKRLLEDDNYADYSRFVRQLFEIARRHKIMNPEKMRTEYGKLIYLLQDVVSPSIRPHLGFNAKGPIESVFKYLEERDGIALLEDPLIETATEEILARKKPRSQIDKEIRLKERAVSKLKQKYRSAELSSDEIHLCLYSICDNNSFLNSNRVPIDKVIGYLKSHFSPAQAEDGYSLSIISGEEGARLSHSHERQYYFALQSLTLWRDIVDDMFRLWAMAEDDLLTESVTYSLQDTGQGMQRVQQSPRTYKAMQKILVRVQAKVSHWVGSSVIHLGDHNVPNALSFIDKYTQVPRILGPIVVCLENVEKICEKDDGIRAMIDNGFGGLEKLKKDILYDFFRSAFDGSGADNFYDAGSCIDGRLTSAWNWCSELPNKPFYPIFKLTGFIGFDGEFK